MKIIILVLTFFLCFSSHGLAQTTYRFLSLPYSAKHSSTAQIMELSAQDGDGFVGNPAYLTFSKPGDFNFSYASYFADVAITSTSAVFETDLTGKLGLTALYINYGDIKRTDPLGNQDGTFAPSDIVLGITYAHTIDESFKIGITGKGILSQIDDYQSTGLALDIGTFYQWSSQQVLIGLVFHHLGTQLSAYRIKEKLPSDLTFSLSKKLEHLPITVGVSLIELNRLGDDGREWIDHLGVGLRLDASDQLSFYGSSKLHQRNDLNTGGGIDFTGVNYGATLWLERFSIGYGYSNLGVLDGIHRIDFSANLNHLF